MSASFQPRNSRRKSAGSKQCRKKLQARATVSTDSFGLLAARRKNGCSDGHAATALFDNCLDKARNGENACARVHSKRTFDTRLRCSSS